MTLTEHAKALTTTTLRAKVYELGSTLSSREVAALSRDDLVAHFVELSAEHDGCGGELILPLHADGSHYRPPVEHPQHCNPDFVMVTCDKCAVVNFTDDANLKRLARTRRQRFVVEAV